MEGTLLALTSNTSRTSMFVKTLLAAGAAVGSAVIAVDELVGNYKARVKHTKMPHP